MIKQAADLDPERWQTHFGEAAQLLATRRWEHDMRYGDALERSHGYQTWLCLLVEDLGDLASTFPDHGERASTRCLDKALEVAALAHAIVEVAANDVYRGEPPPAPNQQHKGR